MPGGQGLRHRTRDLFQRGFRQKGFIPLTTYLRTYKLGDYVDIKMNPAQQKVGWSARCAADAWSLCQPASSTTSSVNSMATRFHLFRVEHVFFDVIFASRRLLKTVQPLH